MPKIKGAPAARRNPHHHRMAGGVEVTAWPDRIVGVAIPKTLINFLLTPEQASQLAAALVEMASAASAAQPPSEEKP